MPEIWGWFWLKVGWPIGDAFARWFGLGEYGDPATYDRDDEPEDWYDDDRA